MERCIDLPRRTAELNHEDADETVYTPHKRILEEFEAFARSNRLTFSSLQFYENPRNLESNPSHASGNQSALNDVGGIFRLE